MKALLSCLGVGILGALSQAQNPRAQDLGYYVSANPNFPMELGTGGRLEQADGSDVVRWSWIEWDAAGESGVHDVTFTVPFTRPGGCIEIGDGAPAGPFSIVDVDSGEVVQTGTLAPPPEWWKSDDADPTTWIPGALQPHALQVGRRYQIDGASGTHSSRLITPLLRYGLPSAPLGITSSFSFRETSTRRHSEPATPGS